MATVAAVIASTHHPFYYRASTATGADRPPFADEWVAKIEAFRETLTKAEPGHPGDGRQRPLPPAVAGQHAAVPGRQGAVLRCELVQRGARVRPAADDAAGEEQLAAHILRNGLDADFDLAFSNELRIDHSITCPIITLRPEADLPIVPIYTNIFAPPLPRPGRFVELGRTIRQLVESWPIDKRVAIIGTGHLSLELGGPRQFGEHGPDPEFDRKAVDWIASGDLDGCLAEVTLDSLHLPGNATHGFMDFMLMMGVAGAGAKADHVDSLDLFHTMEAYFTWYPNGVPA